MRFSTTTRLLRAFIGTMTYFSALKRMAVRSSTSRGSSRFTTDLEWETRVVERRKTGVSNFSLISKASLMNSFASWLSAGSSMGILANLRIVAVVLFVLGAVQRRVVGGDDDQGAVGPRIAGCKQGIGRDIDADMLHDHHRPGAGQSSADSDLHGDLFVGRPFRIDPLDILQRPP